MIKVRVLTLAAVLSASVALSGCVTLFPKSKPAQLYRFGDDIGIAAAPAGPSSAPAATATTLHVSLGFTRAADSDRILTVTGAETAYIADARWISPASVLFDEATARAFETPGSTLRLLRRGDIGATKLTLRLDVETFETDYPVEGRGAPTVTVRVRALLMRPDGQPPLVENTFESKKPASADRMGAIVAAYDAATADVLGQVVGWTTARAAG